MSLHDADAYMRTIKRNIYLVDEIRPLRVRYPYDCETVLSVVAIFGRIAGYHFSDREYGATATQEVEALLSSGQMTGEGKYIVFLHDLVEGGGDFLLFVRGTREEDGKVITGDHYASLVGGSVR